MKKTTLALGLCLLCLLSSIQCKKRTAELAPEVASSDEALFKLGEAEIKKDEEKARLYLRQVIDSFPKSFYAQRAKLLIADSYFKKGDEGNLILAASEYREFISLYPYSPSAPYCQFQIAMTYYRKILAPGRDQTKTEQALAEFKKVVTNYPLSDQAKDAQAKIRDCEGRLAENNASIGKHYNRVHAYKAATTRLTEILTKYPDYPKMDEIYYYLGDSYYKWGKSDQAVPFLTKLVSDYPKSNYVKDAQKTLQSIQAGGPAKKK